MKKTVKVIALILVLLLAAAAAGILVLWHNELASVASFQKIRDRNDAHMDGSVYDMHDSAGTSYHYMVADAARSLNGWPVRTPPIRTAPPARW